MSVHRPTVLGTIRDSATVLGDGPRDYNPLLGYVRGASAALGPLIHSEPLPSGCLMGSSAPPLTMLPTTSQTDQDQHPGSVAGV